MESKLLSVFGKVLPLQRLFLPRRTNGIEAARRIRKLSPDCKIIVLTQDGDEDLMSAALEAGALAYVLKAELATKVIPAIQAALRTRC